MCMFRINFNAVVLQNSAKIKPRQHNFVCPSVTSPFILGPSPIGAVCSGFTLFASILYLSVMLSNYLQQTTSADDIFRCIFSWRFKG